MRNGGIGEQALDAGLHDGGEIAQHHRERGDDGHHRRPTGKVAVPHGAAGRAGKAERENFGEDVKTRDLGAGADERRARRGRAFVGVRRPEMERHGGDLEAEADDGRHQRDQQQRVESLAGDAGGDFAQIGRAGNAVEQAEAEQQKRRRHAAEQKVFQRRLGGPGVVLVERGEDVKREAGEFQRDENHQQILGADQEHQADGAEQNQRKIFADMVGEPAGRGNQNGENRQREQRDLHEVGCRIHDEQAVEQIGFGVARERQQRGGGAAKNGQQRAGVEPGGDGFAAQHGHIRAQHDEHGQRHDGFRRGEP